MRAALTHQARCGLWCAWLALLMAAPYMPRDVSGFIGAWGPSSFSEMFAWAALGMVMGLWLGSYPRVERFVVTTSHVERAVMAAGLAASAVVVIPECLRVLADVYSWPLGWLHSPEHPEVYRAWTGLLRAGPGLVFGACVLCGWAGWNVFRPTGGEGGPSADSLQPKRRPWVFLLIVCAFVAGLLQPLAWTLLLPHAPFPQPLLYVGPIDPEDTWSSSVTLLRACTVPVPLLLMGAFSLLSTGTVGHRGCRPSFPLAPIAALCLGVLAFRVATRVMPSLCATQLWQAVVALALYGFCLGGCLLAGVQVRRAGRCPEGPSEAKPPTTADALLRAFTADGLAYLRGRGLTERELLAMAAQVRGLTAAEAGEILGVAEPTVREYRRRCRKKLAVDDLSSVAEVLSAGFVEGAVPDNPGRWGREAAVALAALVSAVVLALLPFAGAPRVWSDVWATAFGTGIGLAGAWFVQAMRGPSAGCAPGRPLVLAAVCGLVAAAIVLAGLRIGLVLPAAEGAFRRAWTLGGTALFVGCATLIFDWIAPRAGLRGSVGAAVTACAALLVAQLGVAAWTVELGLAALCAAGAAACFLWRPRATAVLSPCLCPWGMPWLAAAALVAWMWSDVYRARAYDSLLPVLQWGACAVLVVGAWGLGRLRGSAVRLPLVAVLAVTVVASFGVGFGDALVLCGLLLVVVWGQKPAREGCGRPWHTGALAASWGTVAGTLATNAFGWPLSANANLTVLGGRSAFAMLVVCVVGALCLAVARACAKAACTMDRWTDDSLDAGRAQALLADRGLGPAQVQMVMLLLGGTPAAEVALRLNYARSTVDRARRDACRAFGVRTCGQLATEVGRLMRFDGDARASRHGDSVGCPEPDSNVR